MGYQLAEADRDSTDPKHLCTKCNSVLKEPVQTTCGHRYCRECINSILSQKPSESACVADGIILRKEEVFPDKFVEREILLLELHCSRLDKGCQWKGKLKHRQDHEDVCEFKEIHCVHPKCGILVQRSDLANHLEKSCNYREELCSYCEKRIVFVDMTGHHQTECPQFPERCPECGKQDIPRSQITAHLDPAVGDCEEIKTVCPFQTVGCKETKAMALDERVNHLKECTSEHLTCVLQHVKELSSLVSNTLHLTSLNKTNGSVNPIEKQLEQSMKQMGAVLVQTKNLKSRVDQQDSRIKSLETVQDQSTLPVSSSCGQKNELQEATRRMHNQEAKVADLEVFVIEGNKVNEDLERQVNVLKIEQDGYKETIRKLQRHVESLEHTLSLRNVVLADLEEQVKQKEISNYNGVLLWKIA